MTLDHYDNELLKRQLREIIHRQNLDLRIFFFGSRVAGARSDRSDIDVGILGKEAVPLEILGRIRDEVENLPILYKIDIIDFQRVSDNFRQVAMRAIEEF